MPHPAECDLAEKVRFLRRRDSYPSPGPSVTVVETHFSFVFLTQERVYKLKKPRRYPFLDLSSLQARRRNCEEEVRLNRALAPEVYLGVERLTRDAAGALHLAGTGRAVDYLVCMRRLPDALCLESRIAAGDVALRELDRAATRLTAFYRDARPATALAPAADARRWPALARELRECLGESRADHGLGEALRARADAHAALLRDRPCIDAHGDLRPEHIYLGADPVFIDRLEFDPALRALDPAEELAFLILECDRLGARWTGERFLARYRALTGDTPPAPLLAFYEARRALLWAVLSARHIATGRGDRGRWRARAAAYIEHGLARLGAG